MEKNKLINLIEEPGNINNNDISELENLVFTYPFFQTAQLLLAKGLLNTSSIRYNDQLKKTAAYCADRKKLFRLITNSTNKKQVKEDSNNNLKENSLKMGRPLDFNENDMFSFSEWLKLSKIKKIKRKDSSGNFNSSSDLINNFINTKISRKKTNQKDVFFKPILAAKESLIENIEIVTPTLAKVYLEQKHYDKAIEAYETLILKNPQKNSFFANQIKLIKKLKEQ